MSRDYFHHKDWSRAAGSIRGNDGPVLNFYSEVVFWKRCDSHRNVDSAAGPTPPLRSHVALGGLGFREARRGRETGREATSNKARHAKKKKKWPQASVRHRRERGVNTNRGLWVLHCMFTSRRNGAKKKRKTKTLIITFPHWSAVESFSNLAHFCDSFTSYKKTNSLVSSSSNMLCSLSALKAQK